MVQRQGLLRIATRIAVLGATAGVLIGIGTGAGTAVAAPAFQISAGQQDTCVVRASDASVWCWGWNIAGELGGATTGNSKVPVQVPGLPAMASVSAGRDHVCGVDTAHNVWCWGANAFGEIGTGGISFSEPPTKVANLKATQVSAGNEFTCAVTVIQTVRCWGEGTLGQLGNGHDNDSSTPVLVKNLTTVTQIAAGDAHVCALYGPGTPTCWGDDSDGQLGNGVTGVSFNTPVVTESGPLRSIAAGFENTCGIDMSGAARCWGLNADGQLGTNDFNTNHSTPTPVFGGMTWSQISMGEASTCGMTDTVAQVWCWGDGGNGRLGNGKLNLPPIDVPVPVFAMTSSPAGGSAGPQQVAVGYEHACVVLSPPMVKCWGNGNDGALGNGDVQDEGFPTLALGPPVLAAAYSEQVAIGLGTGCTLTDNLEVECWGTDTGDGDTAQHDQAEDTGLGGAASVTANNGGCALLANTNVKCWGDNQYGELGNGTHGATASKKPALVAGLPQVLQLSGSYTNCVVIQNGTPECWGFNGDGEAGVGNENELDSPASVVGLPNQPTQISAGFEESCAVMPSTNVYCWGVNSDGALGTGSTGGNQDTATVKVKGLSNVIQVAAGGDFACALQNTGAVYCWGINSVGELGNNSTAANSPTPVQVQGLSSGVQQIMVGGASACALMAGTGQIRCWGDNGVGELGNNNPSMTFSRVPVGVSGPGSWISLATASGAGNTNCAVDSSFQTWCWGDNAAGELGTTGPNAFAPEQVQGIS